MPWGSYLIILLLCAATIALCRTAPALLLKGRELPSQLSRALGYIPPAAFAALVANDLFATDFFNLTSLTQEADFSLDAFWPVVIAWIAAVVVGAVALRTKSLTWCIVVGVAIYGLLLLVPLP